MIALDTNILVYAHRRDVVDWHEPARTCVEGLAGGRDPWALPWSVAHEFVAVVTRLAPDPTPLDDAIAVVEALTGVDSCVTLTEPPGYLAVLRQLATAGRASGLDVFDARIAALCVAHGVGELWTADRDFGRFPRLRTRNPLVG